MTTAKIIQLAGVLCVWLWIMVRGMRSYQKKLSLIHTLLPKLLPIMFVVLVAVIGFGSHIRWLHSLGIGMTHCGLTILYIIAGQVLHDKRYQPLFTHRLLLIVLPLAITGALLSYFNRGNITDRGAYNISPIYYVSGFFNYGLFLLLIILLAYLCARNLRLHKNVSYFVRRVIGLAGLIVGALSVVVTLGNLLFLLLGIFEASLLASFPDPGFTLAFALVVISITIPQAWLIWILRPVEEEISRYGQRRQKLLFYLHTQMLALVPGVALEEEQLYDLRVVIEISDARQIMWSQVPHADTITPAEEARRLFYLLQQHVVFEGPGVYTTISTFPCDVIMYNLAVSTYLQKLCK